jgi:hypothetical protein
MGNTLSNIKLKNENYKPGKAKINTKILMMLLLAHINTQRLYNTIISSDAADLTNRWFTFSKGPGRTIVDFASAENSQISGFLVIVKNNSDSEQ